MTTVLKVLLAIPCLIILFQFYRFAVTRKP